MEPDSHFLKHALELAETHSSDGKQGPFGAVIVDHQQIIGEGWNQVVNQADPTAHAEIIAIRHACQKKQTHQLKGATIYSSCEPCPMCLAAIYWARIERLVFASNKEDAAKAGFDDHFIYQQIALPYPKRSLKTEQRDQKAGWHVFQAWLDNPNRIHY